MARINILDSSVFNLIAAGEVVERPASVVKEIVENSIDAGAKNITIEIKDGGTSFIQVSDDGCGIAEDDIKSAFLPHATSKIKNAVDLESIFTLGFRGEALASIAAVSKVTLVSKPEESELGTKIQVDGGKFGEIIKVGASTGTTITVKDLFYCVPARAKFLKKNKSEEQEITNVITRIILAHPEINFTYIVDGKKNITSFGNSKKEAMFSIYGKEAVTETLEVHASRENVEVSGFVGKPTFSKSNRTYQTLIINGRYVVNLTVQTAVTNAFGDFLMKRQYPFFILYLKVPTDEIDVNVHPNKLDVKFLKSSLIYSVVFEAVSRALNDMDYIKEIDAETNANLSFARPEKEKAVIDKAGVNLNPFSSNYSDMTDKEKDNMSKLVIDMVIANNDNSSVRDNFGLGSKLLERISDKLEDHAEKKEIFESTNYELSDKKEKDNNELNNFDLLKPDSKQNENLFYEDKIEDNFEYSTESYQKQKARQFDFVSDELKFVGKIFNTYLVIEWGESIYLIDQHAAHERINYDKLKAEYETGKLVVQPMLIPFVLSLNAEDNQIIFENLEAIRSVGFEIEEFGERTYKVSSVPAIVAEIDFNSFFSMFLAEKLHKSKLTQADFVKDKLMQMACKSAVKGGDDLSKTEIFSLLKTMGKENVILFCPHGRPVVVRITKTEIEKWFKRIV